MPSRIARSINGSMAKVLIIRFSSFGDVLQTLSVAGRLHDWNEVEVHWVTREEFRPLIELHPAVSKVWGLSRHHSMRELLQLAWTLRRQGYTHVYDAHNSVRSLVMMILFWTLWLTPWVGWPPYLLRRSIRRWRRFLLFKCRINLFQQPFSGQRDLLEPLVRWKLVAHPPLPPQLYLPVSHRMELQKPFIALAPSAAFELKRWPLESWRDLIKKLSDFRFVVLGGKEDHFLMQLSDEFPERVKNLAGQLSLVESCQVVRESQLLIANDTGLLHVGEQLGIPTVALMGPAPFGFPSRPSTRILERNLSCRPCSKHGQGPCKNPEYQKCLRDITPDEVEGVVRAILQSLRGHEVERHV